jgi:hypothetical protein
MSLETNLGYIKNKKTEESAGIVFSWLKASVGKG